MSAFDPDALDAYVRHGFRQDGDLVRLKCDPNTEADTFDNGGKHSTWDSLEGLSTPIVVIAGPAEDMRPSMVAPLVAEEAINGRFIRGGRHGPLRPDDPPRRARRPDRLTRR